MKRLCAIWLPLLFALTAAGASSAQASDFHATIISHAYCACTGEIQLYTSACAPSMPVKIFRYDVPWQTANRTQLVAGWGNQSVTVRDLCPGTYYFEAIWESQQISGGETVENIIGQYTIVIEGPAQFLDVSVSGFSGAPCAGTGWIDAVITGGNGGNTIEWKKDGVAIPGANGTHLGNLDNGTYTITVTDSKGCTKTASFTISGQSAAINFAVAVKHSGCNGPNSGEVEITNLTGTSNFVAYLYGPTPGRKTGDRKWIEVGPGTYSVKVFDINTGCEKSIIITVEDAVPVDFTAAVVNSGCQGPNTGSITITPTSGTAPYAYSWSHDPNLNSSAATNLGSGQYTVTVTDSKGCSKTQTFSISQTPPVDFSLDVKNYRENGVCKARICVVNLTGTAPYTYSWSCGSSTDACMTTDVLPATCTVTVTDANGCKKSQTVTAYPCSQIHGGIVIYPNPNGGLFTATVVLDAPVSVKLDVLDQNFNVVYHADMGIQPAGTNNYPVDITLQPDGMYFLLVTVDNVPPSEAVLVQKQ